MMMVVTRMLQQLQTLWSDMLHLFMIPDGSWMSFLIFGSLAWLPLRNMLLMIRRKLYRQRQRRKSGIFKRGGKFSRDDYGVSRRQSYWMRSLFGHLFSNEEEKSSDDDHRKTPKNSVQFSEHSDGSVYRQRRIYFPQEAPAETATAPNIISTPSPVSRKHERQQRIATPMPKKKKQPVVVMEAETAPAAVEESPYSNRQADKENKQPRRDTPYKPRAAEIYYRSPSAPPKPRRTMTPLRSPTSPYLPPVLDHTLALLAEAKPYNTKSNVSFLRTPRDPNLLNAYATNSMRSPAAVRQQQQSSSSKRPGSVLKRKFEDASTTNAHKKERLTLKRAKRLYSQARASTALKNTPTKRKERHDNLLQEFSRKRPKVEPPKKSLTPVSTNPFGGDSNITEDRAPSFSFGGGAAKPDDSKPADPNKPSFTFGGAKPAPDAAKPAPDAAKPAPDAAKPAPDAAKPAFSFGGAAPAPPAAADATAAPPADVTAPANAPTAASMPSFSFGGKATAPAAPGAAAAPAGGAPAFSFGGTGPPTSAPAAPAGGPPAFSFGGGAPAPAAPPAPAGGAPVFSFGGAGTPAAPTAPAGGASAFSFGGGAPEPAAPPAPAGGAPTFSFGGAGAPAAPTAPSFGADPSFGGAPPVAPGGFGGPAPPGGTGFVPARNANRVRKTGRSRRRGAA
jgi:hypothetical protein